MSQSLDEAAKLKRLTLMDIAALLDLVEARWREHRDHNTLWSDVTWVGGDNPRWVDRTCPWCADAKPLLVAAGRIKA